MTQQATCLQRIFEGRLCGLPLNGAHPDRCILHDPAPEKDEVAFNQILEARVATDEGDASVDLIDLSFVVFPKETDWGGKTIGKRVSFLGALFGGAAYFRSAKFGGEANFSYATFSGVAYFFGVTFSGEANFYDATFGGEARFRGATFESDAESL